MQGAGMFYMHCVPSFSSSIGATTLGGFWPASSCTYCSLVVTMELNAEHNFVWPILFYF
jgi:hypothetical protein